MLLNGLERGEPTLLACAGLCDLEPRVSTLGEHGRGVPWAMGLWQHFLSPRHPLPFARLRECLGVLLPAWVCIWAL